MAKKLNPYKTLGVDQSATPQQVKSAYRKRAMEAHPDRGGSPEEFDRVVRSNVVLSDPKKRSKFDRTGEIDDDAPDNVISAPLGIILGFVQQAAAQFAAGQGGDPCQADLPDLMRQQFRKVISNLESQKRQMAKISDKIKNISDCFKSKKDGAGLLQRALRTQADGITTQMSMTDQQIAAHKDAMTMLDDFTFEFEKQKEHFPTSGFFNMQTFGGST